MMSRGILDCLVHRLLPRKLHKVGIRLERILFAVQLYFHVIEYNISSVGEV